MSFYLKKYMWLISLIAVIICSYFLAKIAANFIEIQLDASWSVPSIATSKIEIATGIIHKMTVENYDKITERNIFDSRDVPTASPAVGETEPDTPDDPVNINGEAVKTSLSIKLISTFAVGNGEDQRSSCVISSSSASSDGAQGRRARSRRGQEDVYTVNDKKTFAPDTKIVRIKFNRVEFTHKGRLEFVELDDFANNVSLNQPPKRDAGVNVEEVTRRQAQTTTESTKIETSGDGKFVIDRSEIDNALANLDKLYTQIRAVPYFKDGKPNGLKLLSVRTGSIFSKLGLQRGDILQRINGMELDIRRGLELFNQLRKESNINIDIERRGQVQTLEYEIR